MELKLYDKNMNTAKQEWREPRNRERSFNGPVRGTYLEDEIFSQQDIYNFHSNENKSALRNLSSAIIYAKNHNIPIIISGSGTSYHNAIMASNSLIRQHIPTYCIPSTEIENYSFFDNSLIIAFSQSGETADLLEPLNNLKKTKPYNQSTNNGHLIAGIVNAQDSTIDNLSDIKIHTNAGPEISVASTKAHTRAFYAIHQLENLISSGHMDETTYRRINNIFNETINENMPTLEEIVKMFSLSDHFFFMGAKSQDVIAKEAALKLKELTYIHAEGYNVADFKHGPLSLIEENTPVVLIDLQNDAMHNAREIQARGGYIIGVGNGLKEISDDNDPRHIYQKFLRAPEKGFVGEYMTLVLMQLLSLKISQEKGTNTDNPRNLAKSVTVK